MAQCTEEMVDQGLSFWWFLQPWQHHPRRVHATQVTTFRGPPRAQRVQLEHTAQGALVPLVQPALATTRTTYTPHSPVLAPLLLIAPRPACPARTGPAASVHLVTQDTTVQGGVRPLAYHARIAQ